MLEVKKNGIYINEFENINEIAKYVTTMKRKSGRSNDSNTKGEKSWYGTSSFEEALELLKYGDENTYNKIQEAKLKMKTDKLLSGFKKRANYENRMFGFVPNVPNFLKNNPINMINKENNGVNHKILNIFLNIRLGGWQSASMTYNVGSKYLIIIDLLEKRGYRCNLYAGTANSKSSSSKERTLMLVRVKTDREPLNIKKICFTIANVAMQRRIKFRWMEVNDDSVDYTGGYGQTLNKKEVKNILNENLKEDFLVWDYENEYNFQDIINELKKDGIEISEE